MRWHSVSIGPIATGQAYSILAKYIVLSCPSGFNTQVRYEVDFVRSQKRNENGLPNICRAMKRLSTMFSFLVATFVAEQFGCTQPVSQSPVALPNLKSIEWVRERVEASFQRAIFYKPREDSMVGLEMTFAPLIAQEVDDGVGSNHPTPFGAIVGEPSGPRVDPSRPTLYAGTFTARIKGIDHDQIVFFWRYPPRPDQPTNASPQGRGVRVTLGSDGLPLVWEALSTDTDTRILYVSESLERAAVAEFGGPLPGRRFSIERTTNEARDAVVARIIDDGPVPMGPYVYLNAPPERDVTTVICRCMPSQVSEFVETVYYDLMPLETIREWGDTRSCVDPPEPRVHWGGTLSYWNLRVPWEERPLEQLLRWPNRQPQRP